MEAELEARLLDACEKGDVTTVCKLIKNRVDVNAVDNHGVSALALACLGGHAAVVRQLLEAGAKTNSRDICNRTALHAAAKGGNDECVKRLVLFGADLPPRTASGLRAIDLAPYDSPSWAVLHAAAAGVMPNIEQRRDVPYVPDFAIENSIKVPKKKGGKKGKKAKGKAKGKKKK